MEFVRTMAKATVKMPEDFLMKISKLGNQTDEIIPKVLKAGAEVVEDKVRSNLQSIIGKGTKEQSRSTGELQRFPAGIMRLLSAHHKRGRIRTANLM